MEKQRIKFGVDIVHLEGEKETKWRVMFTRNGVPVGGASLTPNERMEALDAVCIAFVELNRKWKGGKQ